MTSTYDDNDPTQSEEVRLRQGDIALFESGFLYIWGDQYPGTPEPAYPIRRAVVVARLRALADLIEGGGPDA